MKNDPEYTKKLEGRIHNQRVQLAWWNKNFQMKQVTPKRRWTASQVCALLKRLGYSQRITNDGNIARPVKIKRDSE